MFRFVLVLSFGYASFAYTEETTYSFETTPPTTTTTTETLPDGVTITTEPPTTENPNKWMYYDDVFWWNICFDSGCEQQCNFMYSTSGKCSSLTSCNCFLPDYEDDVDIITTTTTESTISTIKNNNLHDDITTETKITEIEQDVLKCIDEDCAQKCNMLMLNLDGKCANETLCSCFVYPGNVVTTSSTEENNEEITEGPTATSDHWFCETTLPPENENDGSVTVNSDKGTLQINVSISDWKNRRSIAKHDSSSGRANLNSYLHHIKYHHNKYHAHVKEHSHKYKHHNKHHTKKHPFAKHINKLKLQHKKYHKSKHHI